MSSGPSEQNQQEKQASEAKEGAAENLVETVECPNCGRQFVGDYCPDCGQEANPSASATDVLSGLFREVADVDSGFWRTFVGLTVRPGELLQGYLQGARRPLLNPGRYLLVAIVVEVGVNEFLHWIGARDEHDPVSMTEIPDTENAVLFLDALILDSAAQLDATTGTTWFRACVYLVIASSGSLLLFRLFRKQLSHLGEGFGVVTYVVGHSLWVSTVLALVFYPLTEVSGSLGLVGPLGSVGYIVVTLVVCFGPSWQAVGKSALGGLLMIVEVFLLAGTLIYTFAAGLLQTQPEKYLSDAALGGAADAFLFLFRHNVLFEIPVPMGIPYSVALIPNALLWLSPILAHVGIELCCYFRQ